MDKKGLFGFAISTLTDIVSTELSPEKKQMKRHAENSSGTLSIGSSSISLGSGKYNSYIEDFNSRYNSLVAQHAEEAKGLESRETVTVTNCPSCGAPLDRFDTMCKYCGSSIKRDIFTYKVRQFGEIIALIDRFRETPIADQLIGYEISRIRDFVIPNDPPEIMEFMLLASTHIDSASNFGSVATINEDKKKLYEIWTTKFKEAHDKAEVLMDNGTDDFQRIDDIYNEKLKSGSLDKKSMVNVDVASVGKTVLDNFSKYFLK